MRAPAASQGQRKSAFGRAVKWDQHGVQLLARALAGAQQDHLRSARACDLIGDAAEQQPAESAARVRGHDNQVDVDSRSTIRIASVGSPIRMLVWTGGPDGCSRSAAATSSR